MAESGEERKLPPSRVKQLFRESFGHTQMRMSNSASELLVDVSTEFIQLIALAALDRSERPKQYIDSTGIVQALMDLGFEDIAAALPDLSAFTEDLQPK
jgi:hypothetical protein